MFTKTKFIGVLIVLCLGGFAYGDTIYTPIAHWTFDETSGNMAHDSADSHNGTVAGNPMWGSGKIGGSLDFDGSGDYVDLGNISAFNFGSSNFTISFWIKQEGAHDVGGEQSGLGDVICKYNFSIGRQWVFQHDSAGKMNFATYYTNTSGDPLYSNSSSQMNQWVLYTGVRDGSNKYLYVNGVIDANGICHGMYSSSSNVHIGDVYADSSYNYQFFNGKIDDIRVYDYALSANEVMALYQTPEPATILLFGLGAVILRRKR